MISKTLFSFLAVALAASQLLAVQSESDATTPSPWENVSLVSNDTLRAQAHASLFKQLSGKTSATVWDKEGRLKEVVIYNDEVLVRPNSSERIEPKKLPVDQLMLFDYLLIKGESLEAVSELKFDCTNGTRKTKPLKQSSSEIWLKLPSAKLRNNKLKSPVLEIATEVECEISKISLVSKQGLFKEYVRQKKFWDEFPEDFFAEELFRTTVLDQNYKSLSESLSENSEYFLAVLVPSRMTTGTDMANLAGVLADRRVSKMHELLGQLDAPIAAAIAESDYASQFDEYTAKHRNSDIVPIRHRHALESKLFLCSEFCETSKFLQLVEQWSAWHKEASHGRNFQFRAQAGPDYLFVVNLKMNQIASSKGMNTNAANSFVREKLKSVVGANNPIPRLRENWLMTSDWSPKRMDVIKEVPTFHSKGALRTAKARSAFNALLDAELIPN